MVRGSGRGIGGEDKRERGKIVKNIEK